MSYIIFSETFSIEKFYKKFSTTFLRNFPKEKFCENFFAATYFIKYIIKN